MQLRARRPALVLTAGVLAAVTGLSTTASFASGPDRPRASAGDHHHAAPEPRGALRRPPRIRPQGASRGAPGRRAGRSPPRDRAPAPGPRRRCAGRHGRHDRHAPPGRPPRRLPHRHEPQLRGRRDTGLRRRAPRRVRADRSGPEDVPPAPRLHRRRRHPAPVLDPEDRRRTGLRQRVAVRGHPRRPAPLGRWLPRLPGRRRRGRGRRSSTPPRRRSPRHAAGRATPRRRGHATWPPGAVRDPRRHAPRLEHRDHVRAEPDPERARRAHRRAAVPALAELGRGSRRQERRRPGLPVLPPRPEGRQPGLGRLHRQGLAAGQRDQPVGQQLAHLLRRERRQQVAGLGGGRPVEPGIAGTTRCGPSPCRTSPSATTRTRARGTRTCRSPGRRTGRRTPRRSSSTSTTSTTTCSVRRSGSPRRPATSRPATALAPGSAGTRSTPRPTTAPTPPPGSPTAPTSTTRT